jgi:hypothetical protein
LARRGFCVQEQAAVAHRQLVEVFTVHPRHAHGDLLDVGFARADEHAADDATIAIAGMPGHLDVLAVQQRAQARARPAAIALTTFRRIDRL